MTRRLALLTVLTALAAPAPALGATASVSSETTSTGRGYSAEAPTVNYRAAAGERNTLTVSAGSGSVTLVDPAGITPGARCSRPVATDTTRVVCDVRPFNRPDVTFNDAYPMLDAELGDGNDTADVPVLGEEPEELIGGTHATVDVDGGSGNDEIASDATSVLSGGSGADIVRARERSSTLTGGADDDELFGGPADDTFLAGSGADGSDVYRGGAGIDTADYSARRRRVKADLSGDRDDGQSGERDRIRGDVDNITGGRAGDNLAGDRDANVLRGGRGNDRLNGGRGRDSLFGESGRDRLRANDGFADLVSCGRGRDRARLDGLDLPSRCDRLRRTSAARAIWDSRGFLFQDGRRYRVTVACPADVPRACRGVAVIRRAGRSLGSRRFRMRRGRSRDVLIPLRGAGVGGRAVNATLFLRTRRGRTTYIAHYRISVGVSES